MRIIPLAALSHVPGMFILVQSLVIAIKTQLNIQLCGHMYSYTISLKLLAGGREGGVLSTYISRSQTSQVLCPSHITSQWQDLGNYE